MGYERYPRWTNPQSDDYGRREPQDYGRDRDFEPRREYSARNRDDTRDYGREDYTPRDNRNAGYYAPEGGFGRSHYGQDTYRSAYAADGRRFVTGDRDRAPRGDDGDRGFFERAGDEVRSWFGDEDAERRRERDMRFDGAQGNRDTDYHSWRRGQIAALDRDYDEYRRENQTRFDNEFGGWRNERQGQRDSLSKVDEHMDVVGSDGAHVGTVDKVRGDRILLTKSDQDAGGRHHSIPSRWIQTVDGKVTLRKTADEAHAHWKDEERNTAMFGEGRDSDGRDRDEDAGGRILNRSFSGTY